MTGKDLKNAYNSVNPTPAEKERMLRAILDRAEVKQETRKRKEPVVYTAKPVKTEGKRLLPLIAACFAIILLSGFFFFRMGMSPGEPLSSENVEMESAYYEVLQLYCQALDESWTPEMCTEMGISSRTPIANEYDGLYYAFSDLDGDGVSELILSQDHWEEGRTEFLDIYSLNAGEPFLVASDREFLRPMLYQGGVIMHSDPVKVDSDAKDFSGFYRMEGEIFVMEVVVYQAEDGQWYALDGANPTAEKITGERVDEILASYAPAKLDNWKSVDSVPRETPAGNVYDAVLRKYRTALEEGWTKEQCEIEGISLRMQAGADVTKVGYALLDLDGDGREELLIAEESVPHIDLVWDIYTTLDDGTPIQIWTDECNGYQCYLYEGNVIGVEYTGKDEGEYSYHILEGRNLILRDFLQYVDDKWYHTDAEGSTKPISSEEAMDFSYSYEHLKLELTWLADIPEYIRDTDSVERYMMVLEKYKTALLEDWTVSQCEEADISENIPDALPDLGWCIQDLDGNGVEELIVADSARLYDLYTLMPEDGAPGHILTAWGSNIYHLCENGIIDMQEFYSKGCSWFWYTLDGMDLVQQDMVFYTNSDGANQYSYGPDGDNLQPIEKARVGELLNRYRKAELDLTYFTEAQEKTVADREAYMKVLEIYARAVSEEWNPGQCMESGISLMIGYQGDLIDTWGVAFIDLDKNGTEELLITDGIYIYDLYTIIDDEEYGPVRLLSGTERSNYMLMDGNVIFSSGSGSASVSYYTYYTLEGRELVLLEGYMFDAGEAPENPWFYYDGENRGERCMNMDANEIVNFGYQQVDIPFTPIEG